MLQFLPIRNQKRKKEKRYDLLSLSSQVSSRYSKYIRMSCMYVCTSPAHGLFLWLTMAWSKVMMTSTPHVGRRRLRFQWWCGSTYVSTFIKTKRPETWFEKKERKKKNENLNRLMRSFECLFIRWAAPRSMGFFIYFYFYSCVHTYVYCKWTDGTCHVV